MREFDRVLSPYLTSYIRRILVDPSLPSEWKWSDVFKLNYSFSPIENTNPIVHGKPKGSMPLPHSKRADLLSNDFGFQNLEYKKLPPLVIHQGNREAHGKTKELLDKILFSSPAPLKPILWLY